MASLILAEMQDERRWDEAFNSSQQQLQKMAEKVREDIRAGRVRDTRIDKL